MHREIYCFYARLCIFGICAYMYFVNFFFYFRRVHRNVRLVLSLSNLRETVESGCHRWRDLFGSIHIYSCLPWNRRELVGVASHHLSGKYVHTYMYIFCMYMYNDMCSEGFVGGSACLLLD